MELDHEQPRGRVAHGRQCHGNAGAGEIAEAKSYTGTIGAFRDDENGRHDRHGKFLMMDVGAGRSVCGCAP